MPPTVRRDKPPERPRPVNNNGSVMSEAIPVSDLESLYTKIVVYGKNRVGKTTLACQFPKPLLLIAFEPAMSGGATSVVKINGVSLLRVRSSKKAFQLAEELEKNDKSNWVYDVSKKLWIERKDNGGAPVFDGVPWKTHVLDTATSLQTLVLEEITGRPVPEQLDWGIYSRDDYRNRSSRTKEVLRPFLDLGVSTVILAQEKDHNAKEKEKPSIVRRMADESFFASDLGGQTVGWLQDSCDSICQLYIEKEFVRRVERIKLATKDAKGQYEYKDEEHWDETGKCVHRLRTKYHPNYAAGIRAADPDIVPDYVDGRGPKEIYENLMKVIRGERQAK